MEDHLEISLYRLKYFRMMFSREMVSTFTVRHLLVSLMLLLEAKYKYPHLKVKLK